MMKDIVLIFQLLLLSSVAISFDENTLNLYKITRCDIVASETIIKNRGFKQLSVPASKNEQNKYGLVSMNRPLDFILNKKNNNLL